MVVFHQKISILLVFLIIFVGQPILAYSKGKKKVISSSPLLPYGPAGCGLGSIIFGADDGLNTQIPAYTTNVTYSTQSFAISSGTSNCNPTHLPISVVQQQEFLQGNLLTIAKEAAKGEGEFLTSYAQLFGCQGPQVAAFKQTLKSNYQEIFGLMGAEKILFATHGILRKTDDHVARCLNVY